MADEHHNELVQGFKALQPETSVNWKKSEGPDEQIRLSDEVMTFIRDKGIEAELKDKVLLLAPVIVGCLFLTNRK